MIEIDGSFGEGGGQILRTSLALSLITGRAFHLRHVRARRPKPGLQPQHLMSVQAAQQIGSATVRGASLHSTDLVFEPGEVAPGTYRFDIRTAGATGLVLHTLYLPLAWRAAAPSQLTLTGGTHVQTSPIYDFLQVTWRAYLELIGLHVTLRLRRPGFYPRGGGVLEADIEPCARLRGLQLDEVVPASAASGVSAVAGLPTSIAERQARRAVHRLRQLETAAAFREEAWGGGPGTVLTVILNTRPVPTLVFGLGARGKPAERVADEAVDQAAAHLAACPPGVDLHSADQLVLPLALAEGPSRFPVATVTPHLATNVAVIRRFLDRDITLHGQEGLPGVVAIA